MEPDSRDRVLAVLRLVAERLEAWLEGDELAFETLGEALDDAGAGSEELQTAALVLRSLTAEGPAAGDTLEDAPPRGGLRVPSAEERASLSPEAWGYLLDLRRRGSLDPGQFERVLDLLTGSGVRPVGVDFAREVAARVALRFEDGEGAAGDLDRAH